MTDLDFTGQVAIVTGAGGGLGRSYALELARRGARVVVNDLGGALDGTGGSQAAADEVVAQIRAAGGDAVASHHSVATAEGGEAIVQRALDAFGTVDILINNAGILRDRTFPKLTSEDLKAVLEVHLYGAFHVTQPAFRVMKERRHGRLLFTSSAAGLFGNFGQANYAAAKAGVVGLSNVLAVEGEKYGITSNVISPIAASRLTEGLMGDLADSVRPDLVTPLVVLLVSPGCTITHEVYTAGGGRFARVLLGVGPGWFSDNEPTAEDVAEQIDRIRAAAGYSEPHSAVQEAGLLVQHLGTGIA
ncbi:SDR family NAD(P)-dependent oxidoreductase [Kribbella sp. NPDC051586]|uniref:SDR family NAD(P)-dependent oxidoreductase n=1 Tax=Kribbella sp. NPDC051586 TaxID=3364118 RepID=UPI0037938B51